METTLIRVRSLAARSADAVWLHALHSGRVRGRVHSVFDRALNVEDEAGGLFTLACRGLDDAPATIVVDVASWLGMGLVAGDPASAKDGVLRLGSQVDIRLAGCAPWARPLPMFPGNREGLSARLQAARSLLEHHARGGGMVGRGPRPGADSEFESAVTTALALRSSKLLAALARTDFAAARAHARSMIGLGPGLTPAGDDFLLGLFAVLNIPRSPCEGWLAGGAGLAAEAGDATHPISHAALAHAAQGRVRESIVDFIESLLRGPGDGLAVALRRVLAIGATSGADIACGVLAGLELNLRHTSRGPAA